ncbi:TRAP transporter small permease subunit [Thermanaerosceptrum fracticalcis]|uniref:TRAP transporter small permease subunit n=1 Tax=Thermanaerosceptrum fracticalcis TaxID=1712410 RepID=A0A7G6E2L4_THEFR|nr:TRAP transporter small permease [Thermanaerosceptrum fracticalcis]QNB46318.1 TRAP transporter small permease subunit [Thermanaerosceptrum fracticalcis]
MEKRNFSYFDQLEEWFCGLALFSTTIILFINVVLRYVFRSSTTWAEELIRYIMVWIAFIGGSICVRKNLHVAIDFFLYFIGPKGKRIMAILVNLVCFVFSAMMVRLGWQLVSFTMSKNQVAPALGIPMYLPYLALPLGFILMTIRFGQNIYKQVRS